MFRPPPIIELQIVAFIGARGWFICVALIGLLLLGAGLGVSAEVEPTAVVFAFFMPLLLAAIMGTVALGTHRARSEAWGGKPPRESKCSLQHSSGTASSALPRSAIDRVVLHFQLLPREPFEFAQSVAVVVAVLRWAGALGCVSSARPTMTPNPSLHPTRYSGLRPLPRAGELKR